MSRNPPHDYVLSCVHELLRQLLPAVSVIRMQMGLTLDESTPEPDLAIVRGPLTRYRQRHPTPDEVQLLIEVSDATLAYDLGPKCRTYARYAIRSVWVIDVPNHQIHAFSQPSGPTSSPSFSQHHTFSAQDRLPLPLEIHPLVELNVRELLGF